MNLVIDRDRLLSEINALATFSDAEPPAVTRIVFTPTDLKAHAWLKARCTAAGLMVRQDAIGNTFARWKGSDAKAPVVGTGSHIDAIPNAGKYDGVVGVLGGLEAIRALRSAGFRPRHSLELLIFTSEEPTRFGIGCLGSRLLSGTLSPEAARTLTDNDGTPLENVVRAADLEGNLEDVKLPGDYYRAFVELHIEQGPLLERNRVPLGVVAKIAAPASLRVVVQGAGGHAGGVLMHDRRDALCAAAEAVLAVESAARTSGAIDTVATVGMCDVFPGAVNSIPSRVRFSIDIRDVDLERREATLSSVDKAFREIATRRQVSIESELLNADAPADCSLTVIEALSQSCAAHGLNYLSLISHAYHDSLFMARIAPVAMLFIPCRNGYSHRPDEYASPDDIARGTLVLAEALARLSA
jgi:ureidoglycolate amidohydrolase